MISGPSCLYIYEYNNKIYYFFGDIHRSRKGTCHDLGYKCDAFNYNFTNTTNANSTCTTIGALLHNWFNYNNKNNIKTDFYLEEFYTKENEREENSEFNDIMNQRGNITKNIKYQAPFKDKSWMEMISSIMAPCFIKDKQYCPYYPNVHLHYIDVRIVAKNKKLIDTTPFSIDLIYNYVQDHQPTNINELVLLRKDVLNYIQFMIKNYKLLIKSILSPDGYQDYISLISTTTLADYIKNNTELLITNYNDIRMFKVAKELYRLSVKNKFIYDKLIKYIYQLVNNVLYNVLNYEKSIEEELKIYENLKNNKLRGLRRGYNDLLKIISGYDLFFIDMQSVIMDVYTLSRMFIQDGIEVIVYAGLLHIKVYYDFFNQLSQPVLSIDYVKNNTCLINNDIPKYINANKYKNY